MKTTQRIRTNGGTPEMRKGMGFRGMGWSVETGLIWAIAWCFGVFLLSGGRAETFVNRTGPGGAVRDLQIQVGTTWGAAGSPYVVEGHVTVDEGVRLTIEPGVVVEFTGHRGLYIHGTLVATQARFRNRAAETGWRGIYLGPTSVGSRLEQCTLTRAGSDNLGYYRSGWRRVALLVDGGDAAVSGCRFEEVESHAIELMGASPVIRDTTFHNVAAGAWPILLSSGNLYPNLSGLVSSGTGLKAVRVPEQTLTLGGRWTRPGANVAYAIAGNVSVAEGVRLEVETGTVLKFAGTGLYVAGTVVAEGGDAGITMTSWQDDGAAGDSNADGGGTVGAAGQWRGVYLSPTAGNTVFRRCLFRNAGLGHLGYYRSAWRQGGIFVDACAPVIEGCQIVESGLHGIELWGSSARVVDNAFENLRNGGYALVYNTLDPAPVLANNRLTGTGVAGVAVPGGTMGGENRWNVPGPGLSYFVNGEVTVAEGARWVLDPGVVLKMAEVRMLLYGVVSAVGAPAAPIVWMSRKDAPAAGDWTGLYLSGRAGESQFRNVTLLHAGRDNIGYIHSGWRTASVYLDGCSPRFEDVRWSDHRGVGVELWESQAEFRRVTWERVGRHALLAYSHSRPVLETVTFRENGKFGDGTLSYVVAHDATCEGVVSGAVFEGNFRSGIQIFSASVDSNTRWRVWGGNAPYVLTASINVDAGKTLVVDPGATVKSDGALVTVLGTLIADGGTEGITFTSARDDRAGGDSNGDGTASAPGRGDWRGFYLSPESGGSRFIRCVMDYAGGQQGYWNSGWRYSTVYVNGSAPRFEQCKVRYSANHGVEFFSSAGVLTGSEFVDMGDNGGYAVVLDTLDRAPEMEGNSVTGTGIRGVYLPGGSIAGRLHLDAPGASFPYYLAGDLSVPAGQTLELEPGFELLGSGVGIFVDGTLLATGSPSAPIRFGSRNPAPAPGQWRGIYLGPGSGASVLDYCVLENGGGQIGYINSGWRYTAMYVNQTQARLSHLRIVRSAAQGVEFFGSGAVFENSLVAESGGIGVLLTGGSSARVINNTVVGSKGAGIVAVDGTPGVQNCIVVGNGGSGVRRDGGTPTLGNNIVWGNAPADYAGLVAGATDLSADPRFVDRAGGDWRLLAGSPAINHGVAVVGLSATDLDGALRVQGASPDAGAFEFGGVQVSRLVDGSLRLSGEAEYTGRGVFDPVAQTRRTTVASGTTAAFEVLIENRGSLSDGFRLFVNRGVAGWIERVLDVGDGGKDVTALLTAPGGWLLENRAPGSAVRLRVEVTPDNRAPGNESRVVELLARSEGDPARRDILRIETVNSVRAGSDLMVRRLDDVFYTGDGVVGGASPLQTRRLEVEPGDTASYQIRLRNVGNVSDRFLLRMGTFGAGASVKVTERDAPAVDLAPAMGSASGWTSGPIAMNASREFLVDVTPGATEPAGTVYSLVWTAVSVSEPARSDSVAAVTVASPTATTPQVGVYTTNADFDEGVLTGLEHSSVTNQLQLGGDVLAFPYLWVPNSNNGTVSKVDIRTGREVGRYRVGPGENGSPSRTTVDQFGNCWVCNRVTGTAVKIGLMENGQWVDRNGDGVAQTSQDLNGDGTISGDELLAWGADESVWFEVILIPGKEGTYAPGAYTGERANDNWNPGPRGVAVDSNGNVWLGTYTSAKFYHVSGATGAILKTVDVSGVPHTSYGAVMDAQGVLWSASNDKRNVLRFDPATGALSTVDIGHTVYGLGLDRNQHLFVTGWTDRKLTRVNVKTGVREWTVEGSYQSRGVVATEDGDVWTADSEPGTVTRWSNDGVLKKRISVGSQPTGVAVDAAGAVWVVDLGDENIHRIDPLTDTVDLTQRIVGGNHYGYSDMTGAISRNRTTRVGHWSVVHNARVSGAPWGRLAWNATVPEGAQLSVRVRSSADRHAWSAWVAASNNAALAGVPPGKFLQVDAMMQSAVGGASPVLYDLTVFPGSMPGLPVLDLDWVSVNRLRLSWPAAAGDGWRLERTLDLGGGGGWSSAPGMPVRVGDDWVMEFSPEGTRAGFFRLRK